MVNSDMTPSERLRTLEKIFSGGAQDAALSTETLLDVFLVLYDECASSSLRRDKNIAEFIETGEYMFFWCRNYDRSKLTKFNIRNIFSSVRSFPNEFMIVKFLVKPLANRVKELRLSRDDFDMLNLIGKGAFGEVS